MVKIPGKTVSSILFPHLRWISPASITGFIGIHEGNGSLDEGTHIPSRGPAFLVVIGKASANRKVLFVAAVGSVHKEFGGIKRVLGMKLKKSKIKTICKIVF